MKQLLMVLAGLMISHLSGATSYYVSKSGNNTTGTSWATAKNECNQIAWTGIVAGDTIFIDGGTDSMVYTTGITVGKAGTAAGRITIKRSAAAGHSGKVVIKSGLYTDYSYITVDGLDRYKFIFNALGTGYLVRVTPTADFFEFKNVSLVTKFDTLNLWGTPFYANNGHVLVKGCWFHDSNNEDQIKYNGSGTFIIEDSYFSGLAQHGAIHEDIVQFDVPTVDSFIVKRNIFTNQGTDCFMLASTAVNYMVSEHNVFSQVADAIKYNGGVELRVLNTVFDRCRDILLYTGVTNTTIRNCIFNGTSWSGPVHVSGSPQYSLWDVGTTNWAAGTGNQQAAPLFVNEDSPLGADNVPFTADDGFHLQTGSPAINAGTPVGFSSDIMGTAVSGNPDIGAYEYAPIGIRKTENDAGSFALFQLKYQNPIQAEYLNWYLSELKNIKIYDLSGKLIDKTAVPANGVYFLQAGMDPAIYKLTVIK